MKKFPLLLILIVSIISTSSFASSPSKVLFLSDFAGTLKNEFIFDLKFADIYETKFNFDFESLEDEVRLSNVDNIINYFKFDQVGFEFSYRNPGNRNDPYFLIGNFNSFSMVLDDYFVLTFSDLEFGVIFEESLFNMSFWTKVTDLSQSKVGLTIANSNKLGISLGFEDIMKFYFRAGDLLFSLDDNAVDSVYILNQDFLLEYNSSTKSLLVDSIYFDKNDENFYFRIPVTKNLFLIYSNLGTGISFYIELLRENN
ncbi:MULTISPECIES: hypothetical protein [Petrotoga]|uniref:Uncharacterized protein n=2 Tax=Petrotoga sibirica TaxID=156202 RepID=A0A4R8ETA9_9BACT|nr:MULTISPECIES: hypothetical protein [Petrotoga]KUK83234.1 MAG: Uncharacterized protein XD96_0449 [Petrotoga mobilis]POZ88934.1 hypothetical protein AA80_03415 [Petrotoga sibirica DSM 13575]POZ91171.1 hypothetical protein AD60_04235 [Petrotoga sp. SL27]TDX15549.1 hypothetical protein C8D74_10632 [Petrotoga sibirica]